MRANGLDERGGTLIVKHHDRIHRTQCRKNLGTVVLAVERTIRAFKRAHGLIGVQSDNQSIAQGTCLFQVTHMTSVQQIETAVGEHQLAALLLQISTQTLNVGDAHGGVVGGHALLMA